MKKISKLFQKTFVLLFILSIKVEAEILAIGNSDAKVTVKVFSSLTCPHCADFHASIFNQLKEEYIKKGLVKFEHYAFPLDLAALNAELIIRCQKDNEKKFQLLEEIYRKQNVWAVGSDIDKINNLLKKIALSFNLTNNKMDVCLVNSITQDEILNQRIEAQKKYKISSTPTIIVNEKKYTGKIDYKEFKKIIEKNIK